MLFKIIYYIIFKNGLKVINNQDIVILGLGNILLKDEGVGVRVVERLKNEYHFDPPIKIIDGGTLGFALINEIEGCKKLIVIDAVKGGGDPGTIYKFKKGEVEFQIPQKLSAHDIGFMEVLEQWKILGVNPDVIFFGIEPEDITTWSMELSSKLKEKVSRLIELVLEELSKEGIRFQKR